MSDNWQAANGGQRKLGVHAGFQGEVPEKPYDPQIVKLLPKDNSSADMFVRAVLSRGTPDWTHDPKEARAYTADAAEWVRDALLLLQPLWKGRLIICPAPS